MHKFPKETLKDVCGALDDHASVSQGGIFFFQCQGNVKKFHLSVSGKIANLDKFQG